jgi:hypothetical protein
MTDAADLELLRRFEPILRYTHGESFFPMAVDPYLAESELWGVDAAGRHEILAAVGELTTGTLAAWRSRAPDRALYLRFVQEPLGGVALIEGRRHAGRPRFSAPSRLARVGIAARLIDALFDISLLVRGTVPGGTVAAAEVKYAEIRARDPRYYYHGRVVRQAGWTVCQYLFFYAMNDWRSSFSGANDHEADWEQCFVFLEEGTNGRATPVWFARAAHDEVGADLRRRWDDPLLVRDGDHPVIYAGAGSHAAYIEAGEYLQAIPLNLPSRLRRAGQSLQRVWASTFERTGDDGAEASTPIGAVPFVDYARGDGLAVGPGQQAAWTPIPIDDDTAWVDGYDGLFGLDTQDRLAGERAPAGPKWTRDGRQRQSWLDPIAFAGLDATPPPGQRVTTLTTEIADLREEVATEEARILSLEQEAQRLGVRAATELRAGRSSAFVDAIAAERDRVVQDLRERRVRSAAYVAVIDDSEVELARARDGDTEDPRAHLRHVVHPQDPAQIRLSRALDVWSAIGVSLAILLYGILLFTNPWAWWIGLLAIGAAALGIEALVRRRFLRLLLDVTIILAFAGGIILVSANLPLMIAVGLLGIGLFVLRDNIRELQPAWRPRTNADRR